MFFFKAKNCSNNDIFISWDDRIGKMFHFFDIIVFKV